MTRLLQESTGSGVTDLRGNTTSRNQLDCGRTVTVGFCPEQLGGVALEQGVGGG